MLPVQSNLATPPMARFMHENGTQLRLQCFLLVRDTEGRVATVQLQDRPGEWFLPGEMMLLNEDPRDAAKRVAKTWFTGPALEPTVKEILSYPATGGDDDRWYLLFIFEAKLPAGATLQATPDTLAVEFRKPGATGVAWAVNHHEVWERLA